MTEILEMYFPAPILLQYTDDVTIRELREHTRDPVDIYLQFNKPSEEDHHTTVSMLASLRERFKEYRNSLRGLILGKEIVLMFAWNKDAPIVEWTPEDLVYYLSNKDRELARLKLTKSRIIERIITTDLTFRLYYAIYDKICQLLEEIRSMSRIIKNMPVRRAARYAEVERNFTAYSRHDGANAMNIRCPEQLLGFKSSCFPLLSLSGLLQLAMLNFFASSRWEEVDIFLQTVKKRGIVDPSEDFLSDCKAQFESQVQKYKAYLERFVLDVRAILEETDPLERFILDMLDKPTSWFDIYNRAVTIGFNGNAVVSTLTDLVRRNKIKPVGECYVRV